MTLYDSRSPRISTECVPVLLLHAVQRNDLPRVRKILSTSDSEVVNTPCGSLLVTSLQMACSFSSKNHLQIVKALLAHGANASAADRIGRTPLHYAACNGNVKLVELLLDSGADIDAKYAWNTELQMLEYLNDYGITKSLPVQNCMGGSPLHNAVRGNHIAVVQLLLERGASVNLKDNNGDTPLLLAGTEIEEKDLKLYEHIVGLLVSHSGDVNVCNESTGTTPLHHAATLNSLNAIETILKRKDVRMNAANKSGETPLHIAAFAGSRDCVQLLINSGGDLSKETNSKVSVIDVIFTHVPRPLHFLNDVLNTKIRCNDVSVNDVDFKVTMDFKILSPQDNDKQLSVITAMIHAGNNHQSELLQHPLIETFLHLKWERLRIFFTVVVFIHVIFVFSLSAYVSLIIHQGAYPQDWIAFARITLLLSSIASFTLALIQCCLIPRHYFKQYERWLNLFCAFFSFVIAIKQPDATENEMASPPPWVRHISSSVVLAAWIQLMLLMGRFPTFGYYALMFSTVLQNVVKVLLTFVCLVIGFALSFSIQFYTCKQFEDPWQSIVNVAVMMMGEFEYADLFATEKNNVLLRLPATSRVIFIMFIVLSNIVLMNLMVGLAVSDIQGLQREGRKKRLAKQATFLSHLEIVLSHKYIKSDWFPSWLCKRRFSGTDLLLKPGMKAGGTDFDNRKIRCIPGHVLESIIEVAINNTSYSCVEEEALGIKTIMSAIKHLEEELREIKQCMHSRKK